MLSTWTQWRQGKAALDHRHRNKEGEISGKHGNKVYDRVYPKAEKLR